MYITLKYLFLLNISFKFCDILKIGYLRRRTVGVTDPRVRLMNELLTCVKLIKMYAWEKPFSNTISGTQKTNPIIFHLKGIKCLKF